MREEIGGERRGWHSARSISKLGEEKTEFALAAALEITNRLGYKHGQAGLIAHPNFII